MYHQIYVFPQFMVYKDEDFFVTTQLMQAGGRTVTFVHTRLSKTTPRVLRKIDNLFPILRSGLPKEVFAQGDMDDDKWERFITRYGFKFFHDCACTDGLHRRIFVHRME